MVSGRFCSRPFSSIYSVSQHTIYRDTSQVCHSCWSRKAKSRYAINKSGDGIRFSVFLYLPLESLPIFPFYHSFTFLLRRFLSLIVADTLRGVIYLTKGKKTCCAANHG